ncbi:MAG: glycosyltransferase family 4 protein [Planctomycetota bacterium]
MNDARIIYLTAGAGGMYCGSCMHDNALAAALTKAGWDVQLVPTYTPIRTDESDVSVDQVFFGGINVFLQQKMPWLRFVPSFLDRFLDNPKLIRRVTSKAIEIDPKALGQLTVSMLKGAKGNQRKEVRRLTKWMASQNPDLVVFTNILIGGAIPEIKKQLGIPVLVTLQGDDVFLDSLDEPFKSECMSLIKGVAKKVDGFIVHSQFFREYMSRYFDIEPERIHVTPLGLNVEDFEAEHPGLAEGRSPTVGYLARLAPQKGLHNLVDAFIEMQDHPACRGQGVRLRIAGWLGPDNQSYADAQFKKLDDAGLNERYEYVGAIERHEKLEFLHSIDVLSVPTEFLEPKGLYVLEAMAAGVPVVQPDHACFPEIIESSGGGRLCAPNDAGSLCDMLASLLTDHEYRRELAARGRNHVHSDRNSAQMARSTGSLLEKFIAANQ